MQHQYLASADHVAESDFGSVDLTAMVKSANGACSDVVHISISDRIFPEKPEFSLLL